MAEWSDRKEHMLRASHLNTHSLREHHKELRKGKAKEIHKIRRKTTSASGWRISVSMTKIWKQRDCQQVVITSGDGGMDWALGRGDGK